MHPCSKAKSVRRLKQPFSRKSFWETPMGTGSVPKSERCQQQLVPGGCLYFPNIGERNAYFAGAEVSWKPDDQDRPLTAIARQGFAQVLRINEGIFGGAFPVQDDGATDPPPGDKGERVQHLFLGPHRICAGRLNVAQPRKRERPAKSDQLRGGAAVHDALLKDGGSRTVFMPPGRAPAQ